MKNPKFDALVDRMKEIHDRKNSDYAQEGNPYSNFEAAAAAAGCSVDTVFAVLIGIKLARIKVLLGGKTPRNEPLEDSLLDLAVYSALWASWREAAPQPARVETLGPRPLSSERARLAELQARLARASGQLVSDVSEDRDRRHQLEGNGETCGVGSVGEGGLCRD